MRNENSWLGTLTLQNIQADTTQAINIRVVDLGQEADFGRGHRVIIRQEELEPEFTTYSQAVSTLSGRSRRPHDFTRIWGLLRSVD